MADKKKTFIVTLTMIYNATVEVKAESASKATQYAHDNLDTLAPDSIFNKGEKQWTLRIWLKQNKNKS